jgi:hypothetical protein
MTAVQELIKKIKVRIPFFQYSVYQDDFDAAIEKEKEQIIDSFKNGWNWNYDAEEYYNETYNNKNKIKAEKLVNDYMQFCNNNYYDAQKSALFATELMIEVCNTCLLYTKQPIRENDDIYNNLVKVKNELKKLKPMIFGLCNISCPWKPGIMLKNSLPLFMFLNQIKPIWLLI